MANPTQLKGFKPVSNGLSSSYNGQMTPYRIASGYANNIGFGDLVTLTSSGQVNVAAASSRVLGVAQGVSYTAADGTPVVRNDWKSGTVTFAAQDAVILVADDPNLIVEARFSGTNVIPQSSVGNTFPSLPGTPDLMGNSTQAADGTTLTGTASAQLRLVGFRASPDNDVTAANPIGRFGFLNHEFKATTGV